MTDPAGSRPSTPCADQPTDGNPAADLTGRTLGDFHLLRRLGQGGMGQVYLAEQVSLKRKVALKILRGDVAGNPTLLERFKAEARAVARATHANIVQVYITDESAGLHYMALEYVDGRNLREFLQRKGTPELPLALSIMRQAAAALDRAAELGITHRDIKPENILLTRQGEVKVADFGLSRVLTPDQQPLNLTQSGVSMGTPLYMSPEQVEGLPVDPRSDLYSFGVTCYHMLAGEPPFRGKSAFEVAVKHVKEEPPPLAALRPDLPRELCDLVHRLMAKDPEKRPQTGREVLRELAKIRDTVGGEPTAAVALRQLNWTGEESAVRTATPRRVSWFRARGWRWVAFGISVVAVGAGGVALGRYHARRQAAAIPVAPVGLEEEFVLSPVQNREKLLLAMIREYADPGNDLNRVHLGLAHRRELALFYLEQGRLDDARRYFDPGETQVVESYRVLARIVQAIVLSLQEQPEPDESNRLLLEVAGKQKLRQYPILLNDPELRIWIRRALDHNARNRMPQKIPTDLEYLLRQRPNPSALRLGADLPRAKQQRP